MSQFSTDKQPRWNKEWPETHDIRMERIRKELENEGNRVLYTAAMQTLTKLATGAHLDRPNLNSTCSSGVSDRDLLFLLLYRLRDR